jgi:hypothetical protein
MFYTFVNSKKKGNYMSDKISNSDKKIILADLKDEVKQFHPLLEKLFSLLPRVKHVHYTHGKTEKGADFIITREDDVLSEIENIGVIVKVGKIHQDLSRISEQIKECELQRYAFNGRKKIRLEEIWIITNEHITEGAKEKIYEWYSTKKIKFFQNSNLINLIDKHLDSFWYDIPVDIGDYLSKTSSQITSLDNSLSLLSIQNKSFYIDQDIREIDWEFNFEDQKKRKIIKISNFHEVIFKKRIVYIEGRAGYGKSKLLRHTIERLCMPTNYIKYKFVPIYITYKDFVDKYKLNISKVISEFLTEPVKQNLRLDIRLILFIDGFDEKSYDSNQEFEKFSELISLAKKQSDIHFVITSRPLNYVEPQKIQKLDIASYELAPLSISKIKVFFEKICNQIKISGRIVEDIKKSQLFKQLPRSPISAILLANLLNEQPKELPSNLTELYQKYSELMLGRWDISKGLQSEKEYEAAKSIIKNLSVYYIENDLDYIALDEAKGFFNHYLNERNLNIEADALFKKVTQRSGILQKEPQYNRVYFKHRTFAEFFYASFKIDNYDKDFINERVYESYWRNIYFFYLGLKKDCEMDLTKIINITPLSLIHRFSRFVNMSDYFLAGYATPYNFISESFRKIIIETTKLYFDIVKRNVESDLQSMSEINILYIFQLFVRSFYSYEFFKKAVEDSVLDILADSDLSETEKIYSSFFLSVISIDLDMENPFDGLLKEFKSDIPLPIQLALYYESKHLKDHSTLLKKQERKIKKYFKHGNSDLRSYLNIISKKPVKDIKD